MTETTLTERQSAAYQLVKERGLTLAQAAEKLGVTRQTVDFHLRAALEKLGETRDADKLAGVRAMNEPKALPEDAEALNTRIVGDGDALAWFAGLTPAERGRVVGAARERDLEGTE